MNRPRIVVRKKDLKGWNDKGITIEYKGEEWSIDYGKYVSMNDIEDAQSEDEIYIEKYGKKWIVAKVNKKNVKKEKKVTKSIDDDRYSMNADMNKAINDFSDLMDALLKRILEDIDRLYERVEDLEDAVYGNGNNSKEKK